MGATGGTGATGGAGAAGGAGGAEPCNGSCTEPTPYCDPNTNQCVECLESAHCLDPTAARCESGVCKTCEAPEDCVHLLPLVACNEDGGCVECTVGQEEACDSGQTCNLLTQQCTDVEEHSRLTCAPCTNDRQCEDGSRCIAMSFAGEPHGYYCLPDAGSGCTQPFSVWMERVSLSGEAATTYCGINELLTTCEAVLALLQNGRCSGTDGLCSPDGIAPEVDVPGAICRVVGGLPDRCTYACQLPSECLDPPTAGYTCGDGAGGGAPSWCGG
jgi:hypothetical protein